MAPRPLSPSPPQDTGSILWRCPTRPQSGSGACLFEARNGAWTKEEKNNQIIIEKGYGYCYRFFFSLSLTDRPFEARNGAWTNKK